MAADHYSLAKALPRAVKWYVRPVASGWRRLRRRFVLDDNMKFLAFTMLFLIAERAVPYGVWGYIARASPWAEAEFVRRYKFDFVSKNPSWRPNGFLRLQRLHFA